MRACRMPSASPPGECRPDIDETIADRKLRRHHGQYRIMLNIYRSDSPAPQSWHPDAAAEGSPVWLDLIDPGEDERNHAAHLLGMRLPTREETSALELSSRLTASETAIRVNIPWFVRAEGRHGSSTPLGIVLTPELLATVRYAESSAFDQVIKSLREPGRPRRSTDVFIDILESIVDVAADHIENIGNDLSELAHSVFSDGRERRRLLRTALVEIGAMQRQIIQLRSALLGVSRVVTYLCDASPAWMPREVHPRFKVVHADIGSLNEFDQQMSERLQFLLDAVLGFINNDQNDIMRVLTIVSVATVPPMILAGIWGMNFKSIPEYDWPHGYAFGLTVIGISMIVPLIVFRVKKWL